MFCDGCGKAILSGDHGILVVFGEWDDMLENGDEARGHVCSPRCLATFAKKCAAEISEKAAAETKGMS